MDDVFEPAASDTRAVFLRDVLNGLSKPQKSLPCQYFYDAAGSELFEQITELPEYYPTRTETAILNTHAGDMAEALGRDVLLVEYGAGASTKTRILLDALRELAGYVPIDVSEEFLLHTAQALRADYPELPVYPIVGDFMTRFGLPQDSQGQPVGFFPGSTIGNLNDDEIVQFMTAARALLGDQSQFLIGIDLRKDASILIPAYDDAAGVTAKFNLNLLTRINRELGADFDLGGFAHRAIWNDDASRIEMHLESLRMQSVHIGDRTVSFDAGETIHTENSRKFTIDSLLPLFEQTGWILKKNWLDEDRYFAVLLLSAT
ncbi:MAG: L-histidine N(alpha)-methyltransferase [Henriciella sp.]|nr:L-histidine N(alpha)-methyltransferase [Henriciella sp.]